MYGYFVYIRIVYITICLTMINHGKILVDPGQELWQWLTMVKLMVDHGQDQGQSFPFMVNHHLP